MTKCVRIIVLVSAFVLASACKAPGLKIGNLDVGGLINQGVALWDVSSIDLTQEIQFGQNMSAVLLGTRELHPNIEINQYVNKVGLWLASLSQRPNINWRFGVINSDAINAFAAPGGFVFITSGMLMQLDNEAQLAAVLAHEIIHVTEQHHLNAIKSGSMRTAITETLFISAEAYQGNTNADQEDRKYTSWARTVSSAAQELYSKGLHRDDEIAADAKGIQLMAKAGYDPLEYYITLQVLEAIAPDDSSLALLYKTHPTPTERINALGQFVVQYGALQGQLLTQRYQRTIFAP